MFRNTEDLNPFLEQETEMPVSILDTLTIGSLKELITDYVAAVARDSIQDSVWVHEVILDLTLTGYDVDGMNDYDRGILYDVIGDLLERVVIKAEIGW